MASERGVSERILRWWLRDLPPLDGRLRFGFYAGLLGLAFWHWKSPIRGLELYAETDAGVFRSYGLLHALGVGYLDPALVRALVATLVGAWVCAAIGLFTRLSTALTGLLAAFLHGLFWHSNAFNHSWVLPSWVLLVLMGTRANDDWSVDARLRRLLGRQPASHPLEESGFRRKLVLIVVVGFYTAAGVTKLQNAGLAWLDGDTLHYFLAAKGERKPVAHLLAQYPAICSALACFALGAELISPLALVSRKLRYLCIAGWIGLHLGIKISMGPWYFANIGSLLLLVEWRELRAAWTRRRGPASDADARAAPLGAPLGTPSEWAAVAGGTALALLLACVVAFQILWWPLTNVYMYSTYYSKEHAVRAGHPRAAYLDAAGVQRIARSFLSDPPSFDGLEYLSTRARLYGELHGGRWERLYSMGTATDKQFRLAVALPRVIEDLAAKPDGKLEFDPDAPDLPATRFVRELVPVVQRELPDWEVYRRILLGYRLRGERVVLGAAPLPAREGGE